MCAGLRIERDARGDDPSVDVDDLCCVEIFWEAVAAVNRFISGRVAKINRHWRSDGMTPVLAMEMDRFRPARLFAGNERFEQ